MKNYAETFENSTMKEANTRNSLRVRSEQSRRKKWRSRWCEEVSRASKYCFTLHYITVNLKCTDVKTFQTLYNSYSQTVGKEIRKRWVFKRFLKVWSVAADVTSTGRLFQTLTDATVKARSPTVARRVRRTTRASVAADRSCRRPAVSDTRNAIMLPVNGTWDTANIGVAKNWGWRSEINKKFPDEADYFFLLFYCQLASV